MQHIDILRRHACKPSGVLKPFQCFVDWSGVEGLETVNEFPASAVVDGWIAIEPVDIENMFGVRIPVQAFRAAEIRDAA